MLGASMASSDTRRNDAVLNQHMPGRKLRIDTIEDAYVFDQVAVRLCTEKDRQVRRVAERILFIVILQASTQYTDRMSAKKTVDLEKALTDLEKIVEELESGDLPLEKAMKKFEEGIKLTRDCQAALKDAEQKVEILLKSAGGENLEDFEIDDSDVGAAQKSRERTASQADLPEKAIEKIRGGHQADALPTRSYRAELRQVERRLE